MVPGPRNSVSQMPGVHLGPELMYIAEHTLLVTEDGVEILTARLPDSPGGPVARIEASNGQAAAST